eukprot:Partr_v1_DN26835_c0_g1_i1_m40907 putative Abhydrolase domain containing
MSLFQLFKPADIDDQMDIHKAELIALAIALPVLMMLSIRLMSPNSFASVHLHSNLETVRLSHHKHGKNLKLSELIRLTCPRLFQFRPTPYLRSYHLQTIMANIFTNVPPVHYDRQAWIMDDGGSVGVHFYPPMDDLTVAVDAPVVVILHGLTGHSGEAYVREITHRACSPKLPFRAVVVHGRGCGDEKVTTAQLHNPDYTHDIRWCLDRLRRQFNQAKFILLGFSLGANVLINYVGEEGDAINSKSKLGEYAPVAGVLSLANPFDIYICSHALETPWWRKVTYGRAIAAKLTRYYNRVSHALSTHPDIEHERVMLARTPREYDDAVTRRFFGYPTVNQYYRGCGCCHRIIDVKIPTIFVNSLDDPISVLPCIPFDECVYNPNVLLFTTTHGGHCGWFTGLKPRFWFGDFVQDVFQMFVDMEPVVATSPKKSPVKSAKCPTRVFERKQRSTAIARRLSNHSMFELEADKNVFLQLWRDISNRAGGN